MAAITFDTLKFANKLKSAGVVSEHAEAEAEALADIFEINLQPRPKRLILLKIKSVKSCIITPIETFKGDL